MVSPGELMATVFENLSLAASGVSFLLVAICTFHFFNIELMTATNSTCAIFIPGQSRGPPDQGIKDPRSGSINVSHFDCPSSSQREGRNSRESFPQTSGEE